MQPKGLLEPSEPGKALPKAMLQPVNLEPHLPASGEVEVEQPKADSTTTLPIESGQSKGCKGPAEPIKVEPKLSPKQKQILKRRQQKLNKKLQKLPLSTSPEPPPACIIPTLVTPVAPGWKIRPTHHIPTSISQKEHQILAAAIHGDAANTRNFLSKMNVKLSPLLMLSLFVKNVTALIHSFQAWQHRIYLMLERCNFEDKRAFFQLNLLFYKTFGSLIQLSDSDLLQRMIATKEATTEELEFFYLASQRAHIVTIAGLGGFQRRRDLSGKEWTPQDYFAYVFDVRIPPPPFPSSSSSSPLGFTEEEWSNHFIEKELEAKMLEESPFESFWMKNWVDSKFMLSAFPNRFWKCLQDRTCAEWQGCLQKHFSAPFRTFYVLWEQQVDSLQQILKSSQPPGVQDQERIGEANASLCEQYFRPCGSLLLFVLSDLNIMMDPPEFQQLVEGMGDSRLAVEEMVAVLAQELKHVRSPDGSVPPILPYLPEKPDFMPEYPCQHCRTTQLWCSRWALHITGIETMAFAGRLLAVMGSLRRSADASEAKRATAADDDSANKDSNTQFSIHLPHGSGSLSFSLKELQKMSFSGPPVPPVGGPPPARPSAASAAATDTKQEDPVILEVPVMLPVGLGVEAKSIDDLLDSLPIQIPKVASQDELLHLWRRFRTKLGYHPVPEGSKSREESRDGVRRPPNFPDWIRTKEIPGLGTEFTRNGSVPVPSWEADSVVSDSSESLSSGGLNL